MGRHLLMMLVILLFITSVAAADTNIYKKTNPAPPVLTGLEDVPDNIPVVFPPYDPMEIDGVDILGDTVTVGNTWYEYQHNGQIGRQVVKDEYGYIHIVWTKGEDEQSNSRHVYYTFIDPSGVQGWPGQGYPVESAYKGGFTSLAVGWEGRAFPAFHQVISYGENAHSAVAVDFFPHTGAFLTYEIPWYLGIDWEYIWPRIAMKQDGEMLVTSVGNSDPTGAVGQTWSMGTYDPAGFSISFTDQILTDPIANISNEASASKVSNRVGSAYCATLPAGGGWDVHAMVDDDGLNLNFDNWWNVTNFLPPDSTFLPDTLMADADTLRAYTDCCLFFDMYDYCHIAFTTIAYFSLEGGLTYWNASMVWHWSEQFPEEYQIIANAFEPENIIDVGGWDFRAQRPSLGEDPETGYLYCMYQEYDVDSSALSAAGWPSGEIKISVSTDRGENWSEGTNITNTVTPVNAQPGECLSEAWPSMAELVDGFCHIVYVLDYDAGANLQNCGSITLNPIIYHKVPVDLIPTTPLVPQDVPFHVEHVPPPPSVRPGGEVQPTTFALEQNVPNPFNPLTHITFSLAAMQDIDLSVYNAKGQMIATLAKGPYSPGTHTVLFDGSNLASGVYLYRLEAGGRCLQKKMLLVK